jgi:hypothetical protein
MEGIIELPPSHARAGQRICERHATTADVYAKKAHIGRMKDPLLRGQRRNRNRLAFLAPDQAALEDIQNVVNGRRTMNSLQTRLGSMQRLCLAMVCPQSFDHGA